MKTKQTEIDIFKEKLIDIFEDYHDGIITLYEYIEEINKATQQAKEMEKEIIVKSYSKGYYDKDFSYFDPETYYKETYGGKNE